MRGHGERCGDTALSFGDTAHIFGDKALYRVQSSVFLSRITSANDSAARFNFLIDERYPPHPPPPQPPPPPSPPTPPSPPPQLPEPPSPDGPSAEEMAGRAADRDAFVAHLMDNLMGVQAAKGPL